MAVQYCQVSWAKRLFFALLVIALLLSAAEGVVRLLDRRLHLSSQAIIQRPLDQDPFGEPFPPLRWNSAGECEWPFTVRQPIATSGRSRAHQRQLSAPTTKPARKQVFIVGGSAAWGSGVTYDESFGAQLGSLLGPSENAQVYNAAHNGFDSEQVAETAAQIIDCYYPETLVVFSGNNEWGVWYYRTEEGLCFQWHRWLHARSTFYRYLLLGVRRFMPADAMPPDYDGNVPVFDDARGCGPQDQYADPFLFSSEQVANSRRHYLAYYEHNLEQIVLSAKRRGVSVVLLTLPFRYDLCPAYFYVQPLTAGATDRKIANRAKQVFADAMTALTVGRSEDALRGFEQVTALAPEAPQPFHFIGRLQLERGERAAAAAAFRQARENQVGNMGAVLSVNDVVRRVASENQTTLVDVAALFAAAGRDELDTDGFLHDFCHPTAEGHRLIAGAVNRAITEMWRPTGANPASLPAGL
jgi:hypothetical protein